MSICSKDVKYQKVKHLDYGGGLHKSHIFISISMSNMKVIKIGQKYFLWTFLWFLVMITYDVKIDVNICEPHYVNFFL